MRIVRRGLVVVFVIAGSLAGLICVGYVALIAIMAIGAKKAQDVDHPVGSKDIVAAQRGGVGPIYWLGPSSGRGHLTRTSGRPDDGSFDVVYSPVTCTGSEFGVPNGCEGDIRIGPFLDGDRKWLTWGRGDPCRWSRFRGTWVVTCAPRDGSSSEELGSTTLLVGSDAIDIASRTQSRSRVLRRLTRLDRHTGPDFAPATPFTCDEIRHQAPAFRRSIPRSLRTRCVFTKPFPDSP